MSKSGTVKNWNDEKGFGFIGPDDGGEDVFMHRTALPQGEEVQQGDSVRFDVSWDDRKGKSKANNVTVVGGSGGGGGSRGGGQSYGGKGGGYGG
eukprot:CAMPEP_0168397726 /NCGR_PEP_ID=MMETSP0228-20121227/21213_1 /TAXON_ID=133427 /ORGANISM="Protoceratium reticulatum, Strain CCCM 535 (=CCMP 1889)" /LENGTH=93 /DNA_ID=CAMNT_0008411209 /DNA_START=59 /DNA_END=337 /DNA_ORIENTATION=+